MNYKKIYIKLIRKAQNRSKPECYCEEHHIFPESIFGKNNKIVILTAREHVFVHHLLWRYYKEKRGTNDDKTKKMLYAINKMIYIQNKKVPEGELIKINSREYQQIREEYSKNMSQRNIGENNPMFGKHHSNETKVLVSNIHKKSGRFNGENNPMFGRIRRGEKHPNHKMKTEEKRKEARNNKKNKMIKIKRIDVLTGEIKEYECLMDADREGFCRTVIQERCNKSKIKSYKGYYWSYV